MDLVRVILISGCSSGIGRDLAARLSASGQLVVATARRSETLEGLDAALKLPLDVTSAESVRSAVAATLDAFGRIDVLVNNAGFGINAVVEELEERELEDMFAVNVVGALRLMRATMPGMRERRSGTILNVSSIAGLVSTATNAGYAASKYALEALSDAARQELAPFGVRVILVEPGPIRSNFDETDRRLSSGRFSSGGSPYAWLYEKSAAASLLMRRREPGPEAVSRVVLRALRARRPRARYLAAPTLPFRLMRAVGAPLRDRLFALVMKPPRHHDD